MVTIEVAEWELKAIALILCANISINVSGEVNAQVDENLAKFYDAKMSLRKKVAAFVGGRVIDFTYPDGWREEVNGSNTQSAT